MSADTGAEPPPALQARRLMRAAPWASLATAAAGQPFGSLVTPALAPDGSVLLWLSTLSEHTRQLAAEPRCALLFAGEADGPNPQTTPRVTVTGLAERVEGEAATPLKARWLARHPYAALYAGFADFGLWRVRPGGALLVGGFARALRLRQAELLPDPAAVAALAAAEPEILAHVNAEHADALLAIARGLLGAPPGEGPWRLTGVDPDGCDLAASGAPPDAPADTPAEAPGRHLRLEFAAPVRDAGGVRTALVAAAREGRGRLTPS